MLRLMFLAGTFIAAAPVIAQDAPPPTEPPVTEPAPIEQTEPTTAADIDRLVQVEFPGRDADGSGTLNEAEFSAWIGELLARRPARDGDQDRSAWIASAFTRADTDGSGTVDQAEMTAFLLQPR